MNWANVHMILKSRHFVIEVLKLLITEIWVRMKLDTNNWILNSITEKSTLFSKLFKAFKLEKWNTWKILIWEKRILRMKAKYIINLNGILLRLRTQFIGFWLSELNDIAFIVRNECHRFDIVWGCGCASLNLKKNNSMIDQGYCQHSSTLQTCVEYARWNHVTKVTRSSSLRPIYNKRYKQFWA